jgi:hypothetical protein
METFGTLNDPVLQFLIAAVAVGLPLLVGFALLNHLFDAVFGKK